MKSKKITIGFHVFGKQNDIILLFNLVQIY